jgi:acetyl esterase
MGRADLDALRQAMQAMPPPASINELRASFALFSDVLNEGAPAVAGVRRADLGNGVAADIITPRGTPPFPVLVYLHGGGWSIGSAATHAKLARQLAAGAGTLVVNVDYRLAPEHPFPAACDDAAHALSWSHAHAAELDGDPRRLAVGGDSAGANLTAAAILATQRHVPVRAALLCYGAFDLVTLLREHATRNPDGKDPMLPYAVTKLMVDAYLTGGTDPADPRVSPWRANLRDFPPTCAIVGNADPILDQTLRFHDALRTAGVRAELHRYDDMPHAFLQLPGLPEADQALGVACDFLRTTCG